MCSAKRDPLVPVEKFSIVRTVFFSRGTEVPPDVRKNKWGEFEWLWMNCFACSRCCWSNLASLSDSLWAGFISDMGYAFINCCVGDCYLINTDDKWCSITSMKCMKEHNHINLVYMTCWELFWQLRKWRCLDDIF